MTKIKHFVKVVKDAPRSRDLVLYTDKRIVIMNKPSGLISQPELKVCPKYLSFLLQRFAQ